MTTGDNNRFLREWCEVDNNSISHKWFFYNKGGGYRKWYGSLDYVIIWENDGEMVKNSKCSTIRNPNYYFRRNISWNLITTDKISVRAMGPIFVMGDAGPACYIQSEENYWRYLALLNSVVSDYLLKIINPTINYSCGVMEVFPVCQEEIEDHFEIISLSKENVEISAEDWNCFETSRDFQAHPLVPSVYEQQKQLNENISRDELKKPVTLLSKRYYCWEQDCDYRFSKLKKNEEELNRIFIDIYGLQDELTPEVEDKDVTVRKADLQRDIRSFISYAVGCMFGRYSLDMPGLAFAGGSFSERFINAGNPLTDENGDLLVDENGDYLSDGENCYSVIRVDGEEKLTTFAPDYDNILPICDDEYFEDDIVRRFVEFVETVYGKDTLEENLKYIADALGGKGSPREVIRNYFLNDFYADHLKVYQKRPIYWLFDSGKKNGFKCLIYMHRYQPDTIARIRTDYVHELQSRYRTAIDELERRISDAATAERVKLNKQLAKLQAQADELRDYEEKIHHLADQMIPIDLDDGVKVNYAKFQDVLAKIK